jgi:hypothetical protein
VAVGHSGFLHLLNARLPFKKSGLAASSAIELALPDLSRETPQSWSPYAVFSRGTSEIQNREKMPKSLRCAWNSPVSGAGRDANWGDLHGFPSNSAENL